MALYTPDYEYLEAKKVVDELGDSRKDNAIKYYIQKHQESHDEDKKKLKEFHKFFEQMSLFLPRSGGILR